jgi:uncharacterized protein YggE
LPILLILAAPLVAQLSNNTVTVTASQSSTAQPDEAVFSVTVGSGVDKSLDDAAAAVSGLGITAANLVSISTPPSIVNGFAPQPGAVPTPTLGWIFQLVVPFSKLKDTTAALTSLQKTISQNNSGLTLSFTLSGTRISSQQAPNCNLADLISKVRTQAQQIASSAGLTAGAIVGLTSFTPSVCSLTVRFALGAMFGQPGPNSITITAVRTNAIQPDQVLIGLNVQSGTTAGLDDVTGALTGAGIAGATFTGVYTTTYFIATGVSSSQTPQPELVWSFTLTAPLAKLSATLTQILFAQQAISAKNSGLSLTFYVESTQVSPQLQQSQTCPQAALLADAQAQAKQVAAAAGVSAGPILSMAEGSSIAPASLQFAQVPLQFAQVPPVSLLNFNGVINSGLGYASFVTSTAYAAPPPTCSLTVQFQLM